MALSVSLPRVFLVVAVCMYQCWYALCRDVAVALPTKPRVLQLRPRSAHVVCAPIAPHTIFTAKFSRRSLWGGPSDPLCTVVVPSLSSPFTPWYISELLQQDLNRVHPDSFESSMAQEVVRCEAESRQRYITMMEDIADDGCLPLPYRERPAYMCELTMGFAFTSNMNRLPSHTLVDMVQAGHSEDIGPITELAREQNDRELKVGDWLDVAGSIDIADALGQLQEHTVTIGASPTFNVDLWLHGFQTMYQAMVMETFPNLRAEDYGNAELAPLWPQYFLLSSSVQDEDDTDGWQLHDSDRRAWLDFYDAMNLKLWPAYAPFRDSPCLSKLVGCLEHGGALRIDALVVHQCLPTRDPLKVPPSLGTLQYLRALIVACVVTHIPDAVLALPRLQMLRVAVDRVPSTWGAMAKSLRSLKLAVHGPTTAGSKDAGRGEASSVSSLESICQLRGLMNLRIEGAHSPLPACIGNLSSLVRIRFTGNDVDGGFEIPNELGQLRNLRTFIAFHNGESHCPRNESERREALQRLKAPPGGRAPCRLKSTYFGEQQHSTFPMVCREGALYGTFPTAFRQWTKLNKLWLDGNWLTGTIPDWLGDLSQLRRLDLHDNQLSGTLPSSFLKLTQLEKVQMQNNFLSGALPTKVADLPRLIHLNVGLNPNMTGCLSRSWPKTASVVLAGTQVRGSC